MRTLFSLMYSHYTAKQIDTQDESIFLQTCAIMRIVPLYYG